MNNLTIRPAGAVALPDNTLWCDRFEICSETSDRVYIIAKNKKSGKYGCSCPSYRVRRYCKHLTSGCGLSLAQIHGNELEDKRPVRKALKNDKPRRS
jgi:hypothetical protein